MRRAAKRDANEPSIRDALHAAGFKTAQISQPGLPDLLVWRSGRPTFVLFEVKDGNGQLTEDQLKFWTDSAGTLRFVVRSPEMAVQVASTWIGGANVISVSEAGDGVHMGREGKRADGNGSSHGDR